MRNPFVLLAMLASAMLFALPAAAQAIAPAAPPGFNVFGPFAPLIAAAVPALVPVFAGPVSSAVTELLKRLPAVPFTGETTRGLVAVLTAVSLLVVLVCDFAIAWLTGNVLSFDVNKAGLVLSQVAACVMTAAGAFGLVKKAAS